MGGLTMRNNRKNTLKILLGIAKWYKSKRYLTQRQEIIVEFNVVGGLPNFKNLVMECELIESIEKSLLTRQED